MMKEIDFENYDNLIIYAKKHKINEIKEQYNCLGWELIRETENEKYEDLIDLQFIRPHKIDNKDELQILQIYMEESLNKLGKLEKEKFAKTSATASTFGTLGLLLPIIGILCILSIIPTLGLIGGILLIAIGVVLITLAIILTPRIYKKELETFYTKSKELNTQIEELCKKALKLSGGVKHE